MAEAIAFCGLISATAYLEINGKSHPWLWALVVMWSFFGTWGQRHD